MADGSVLLHELFTYPQQVSLVLMGRERSHSELAKLCKKKRAEVLKASPTPTA